MLPIATRCRFLLAGFAASALLAAPAVAGASTPSGAPGCPETPVTQPFAPWGDQSDYFLAPGGDLEGANAGWSMRGRAAVVAGNEPFHVVAADDHRSLRLPAGSSATTASFCIGLEHRTMRFFADAAAASSLNVDVLYADSRGVNRVARAGTVAGADDWAPTDVVPMVVNELAADHGNALSVRLRFTPHGAGTWTIDDILVDPYQRR